MLRPIQTPQVRYETVRLLGGLDLVTPLNLLKPGVARDSLNFEASVTGGYSRIRGYERFDGRTAPSSADFSYSTLDAVANVAVGDTITNNGGSPTAVVIAITGTTLVYTKATGSFAAGNVIKVGADTVGTVSASTAEITDAETLATYKALAQDEYRDDITTVPGSGPIRGVLRLGGVTYAWRNNVGGTAMAIYKSSSSGWTAVSLGYELAFNTGADTQFAEGATVYGGTSGATGVVARVALQTSAWVAGSGRLILSSTTGTFQNGEALKLTNGAGVQKATCGGAATAITLAASGRVTTVIANMGGAGSSARAYGADGVNKGFEFDGTVYVPIVTGMSDDTPDHVAVHKNYLFFMFGPSVQSSSVGTPHVWSPVFGTAQELVLSANGTGFLALPGAADTAALALHTVQDTELLYGVASGAWNKVPFDRGIGAAAYTQQMMTDGYTFSSRGVMSLTAGQNFGNFDSASLTFQINPFVQTRRAAATAAGVNREKSQYRVFFNDGYGLYITIVNGTPMGAMPVQLFADGTYVTCWTENDTLSTTETSFFGASNGYVYMLDSGINFDGSAVPASLTLPFNDSGNARMLKRYRRVSAEIVADTFVAMQFGYTLAYGSSDIDQAAIVSSTHAFSTATWDAFVWDEFTWDSTRLTPIELGCDGTGENIAVQITSTSRITDPFTINAITQHYSVRRGLR